MRALIVAIALCVVTSPAWAQEEPPGKPAPGTSRSPVEPNPGPPVGSYPLELLGLLAPPTQRGPMTLTPSIAVSEEYNDNIFLNNRDRQWDFITSFTPALTLSINRPSYQLSAGYSFGNDVYAREDRLSHAFERQNFVAYGLYQATPGLTLTVADFFAFNRNTNLLSSQTFSTGRQESWSNTFTPGLTWQMTPRNSLSLSATHSVLRFEGEGGGLDSDTYGFLSTLSHAFTPRLSGLLGYGFTYIDVSQQGTATTHTPTLGVTYQLTQTLRGSLMGGPAITESGGDTTITSAGTASLEQTLPFGSAGVQYARSVSPAGGFGGVTDTQTASGTLILSGWQRGLLIVFNPVYSVAESVSSRQTRQVDVKTLLLNLSATYQITRFVGAFGGYTFFQQRTGGSSSTQLDIDQNRIRFGLQFGYPIIFD